MLSAGYVGLSLAASALQAGAKEETQHAPNGEEIVVTGERVPRTLRDTASSVDVATAERIEALSGADRIELVLQQMPNVVLGGPTGPAIRGQDANGVLQALPGFLGGARPRTTIQIDGRPVTYNELAFGAAGIWDVERAEVFRTPQTTTQGLNSIAGAIFIHSKDPSYDWEGRGRVIAGNYNTRQASIAVSGPIIDDQLAFRAAADIRRGRTSSKILDVTRGADPNNDHYSLVRFKLLGVKLGRRRRAAVGERNRNVAPAYPRRLLPPSPSGRDGPSGRLRLHAQANQGDGKRQALPRALGDTPIGGPSGDVHGDQGPDNEPVANASPDGGAADARSGGTRPWRTRSQYPETIEKVIKFDVRVLAFCKQTSRFPNVKGSTGPHTPSIEA